MLVIWNTLDYCEVQTYKLIQVIQTGEGGKGEVVESVSGQFQREGILLITCEKVDYRPTHHCSNVQGIWLEILH